MAKRKKYNHINRIRITFDHPDGCSSIVFTWDHRLSKRANVIKLAEVCINNQVSMHAAIGVCDLFDITLTTLHNAIRKLQHERHIN
jgi:hypothetical protein